MADEFGWLVKHSPLTILEIQEHFNCGSVEFFRKFKSTHNKHYEAYINDNDDSRREFRITIKPSGFVTKENGNLIPLALTKITFRHPVRNISKFYEDFIPKTEEVDR